MRDGSVSVRNRVRERRRVRGFVCGRGEKGIGVHGTPYAVTAIINSKSSFINSNAGRRFDTDTGLYYYRARCQHPDIGRFLPTDPTGYEGGAKDGDNYEWRSPLSCRPHCLPSPGPLVYRADGVRRRRGVGVSSRFLRL